MPEADPWSAAQVGSVVTVVPAGLWLAALLFAGIAIWRSPEPVSFRLIADRLLRYLFLLPLGVQGIWAFLGHVFLPEEAASAIGWAPSPFQYEVGVANLGLGLASFYAAFKGFEARAATAIAASCFLAGAGFGHLLDIMAGDNLAPGNAGPILITDFLTPIAILVLLILSPRQPELKAAVKSQAAEPSLAGRIEEAMKEAEKEVEKEAETEASEEEPPTRLEDELEHARKAMREALNSGPKQEVLPPDEPPARPGKGSRSRRKGAADISDG
ncbi:MAG: DUF6790 family protein [Methyloceanibacter sp.]